MPDNSRFFLRVPITSVLTTTLYSKYHYYAHISGKETEAQGGKEINQAASALGQCYLHSVLLL